MSISIFDFAWLIPLLPLLAFVFISLFTQRDSALSQQIATYGALTTSVLAQMVFWSAVIVVGEGGRVFRSTPLRWFTLGNVGSSLGVYVDPAGAVMLFTMPLICLMALIYSVDTVKADPRSGRLFALLSLFTAGLLGLLVFNNLLIFFIFWGMIDAAAYLLLSLPCEGEPGATPNPGLQAFLINAAGTLSLLLGLALLYASVGSLAYSDVFSSQALEALVQMPFAGGRLSMAMVVALLLFGGVMAKSAQFPLHVWLPRATRATVPAMSLLHAGMSSAGVVLLIRAFPLFGAAAPGLLIPGLDATFVAAVGAFTAIFAALVAVVQRDIRRALSFSTLSQLGHAVAALGMGGYVAGVFHLVTSAIFSALLFLAAGSLIRGVTRAHREKAADEELDPHDMLHLGGMRQHQPITFWAFFVGAMALAGLPVVTAGFWSKDAVLAQAWVSSPALFWILALASGLISFSAMRQICLIFIGPARSLSAAHARESGPSMTVPMVILAVLAVVSGWTGIPERFPLVGPLIPNGFRLFVGGQAAPDALAWEPTSLGIAFGMGGLLAAFLVYAWRPLQAGELDRLESAARRVRLGRIYRWTREGFYLQTLYRWFAVQIATRLPGALGRFDLRLDRVVGRVSSLAVALSRTARRIDAGIDAPVNGAGRPVRWLSRASAGLEARLDAPADLAGRLGRGLALTGARLEEHLNSWIERAGRIGRRLAATSGRIETHAGVLINLAGAFGLWLARLGGRLEGLIDGSTDLVRRAGVGLAQANSALDPRLDRIVNRARMGALALSAWSGAVDRQLDVVAGRLGEAIKMGGLWFRPKTGKVQSYLLVVSAAVVVLAAIFLFLFAL